MPIAKTAFSREAKRFRFGTALILTLLLSIAPLPAASAQTFTKLYDFGATPQDPAGPYLSVLAQGRDGSIYSTSNDGGGTGCFDQGCGTIYKITTTGELTLLYEFGNLQDYRFYPSGVTLGSDGNFYGTTWMGGDDHFGLLFKITPDGDFTILHDFQNRRDGSDPMGVPIEGSDGNLYGTTVFGGAYGSGTLYRATSSGELKPLHAFEDGSGSGPCSPLVELRDGNFYGITLWGGTEQCRYASCGAIFKASPNGKVTLIHSFDFDTGQSSIPMVVGTNGNLYGTTQGSGGNGYGTVFKVTPSGDFQILHYFSDADGKYPYPLVYGTDRKFYGGTDGGGTKGAGTIYRISPKGALSVLYNFTGDSGVAAKGLMQHTDGHLYGYTQLGGRYGNGTFFRLDIGLGPFAAFVIPAAPVGKTVGILGQGFTGTVSVEFNGTPATFNVVSDTYLEAVVPEAATDGVPSVVRG